MWTCFKNSCCPQRSPWGHGEDGGREEGRQEGGKKELRNQNCCWLWVVPGEVNAREGRGGLAMFTLAVGLCGGVLAQAPHCS